MTNEFGNAASKPQEIAQCPISVDFPPSHPRPKP